MQPVIETTSGRLRGRTVGRASTFKGVRYAASTAGRRRFAAPVSSAACDDVVNAAFWPASAPQWPVRGYEAPFYAWYSAIEPIDEDCLFLNVFAPAERGSLRPVMVWLHGGGWGSFASSAPGCDGARLAAREDLVVVTVNHRLNVFGYLPATGGGELGASSGAAGLLDLVKALEWVRDNAAAFGGDPGNVTIFGQSGGAAKVAALLTFPAAQGLFHKAIVQSMSGGLRLMGEEESVRASGLLAQVLGMSALDANRLRDLPMKVILDAARTVPVSFRPVAAAAGALHPSDPGALAVSAHVPLLVGTTDTETTWYYPLSSGIFDVGLSDAPVIVARVLGIEKEQARHLVEVYRDREPDAAPVDIVTAITTDQLFKRNTFRFADLKAEQGGASVFSYIFARETNAGNGRLRSPHSAEVPFIFGTTEAAAAHCGTGPDIEPMTRTAMATWAAFARTGRPETSHVPDWPAYSAPERRTMVLDLESRLVSDPVSFGREALEGVPPYEYAPGVRSFALSGDSPSIIVPPPPKGAAPHRSTQ